MDEHQPAFPIRLVRYDVRGWTAAQSLAPIAVIAGVMARRMPNRVVVLVALALFAASIALFVRSRKNFGWKPLEIGPHALRLADAGVEVSAQAVHQWTFAGTTARLYGSKFSYRLDVASSHQEALERALALVFGRATPLKRRGSLRARIIALSVCALGLVGLAAAIALSLVQLLFVAVPAIILGFATFMALSQRIAAS